MESSSLYTSLPRSLSHHGLSCHTLSQCIPSYSHAVVRLASEANTATFVHAGCDSGPTRAEDLTDNIGSNPTKMPSPASYTRFCIAAHSAALCAPTVLLRAGGELALDTVARTADRGLGWHLCLTYRCQPSKLLPTCSLRHPSHSAGPCKTHAHVKRVRPGNEATLAR